MLKKICEADATTENRVSLKNPSYFHASGLFFGRLGDIIISSSFRGNEGLKSCLVEELV